MPAMLNLKQYMLSGSLWVLGGKIVTAVCMMGFYVLTTRFYPPKTAGTYFLSLNVATFFSFIAQGGLGYTAVKVVPGLMSARTRSGIYPFMRTTLGLLSAVCITVGFFYIFIHYIFLSSFFFPNSHDSLGIMIAGWVILLALQFNLGEFFRAFRLINLSVFFSGTVSSILALLFLGILIWLKSKHEEVYSVIYCTLFALIINVIWGIQSLMHFINKYTDPDHNSSKYKAQYIFLQSAPYMVCLLAFFITSQSDIWLAGAFLEKSEVAIYAAAARIALLTNLLLTIVEAVVTPLISEMYSKKKFRQLESLLRKTATIIFLPAIIIFLTLISKGDKILELLYGPYYQTGYLSLVLLSIAQAIIVITGSCGPLMLMAGKQREVMYIALMTAMITIGAGIVLVPWLGKEGAAIAVVFSLGTQQILRILYAKKYLGIITMVDVSLIPSLLLSCGKFLKNRSL